MSSAGRETLQPFQPGFPLVEAKLLPPAPRSDIVDRPRLVRLLTDTSGARIVSLVAPPGYGKTTLLSQWTTRERRPVAWLTLDDLLAVLLAVAGEVGSARVVSAAPRIALAAGYDVEAALE